MSENDADGMANSVDPDRRSSLIWVCTVCPDMSVRKLIDSEINHKRHFIKIPFINKGIEFIDLPIIFKDRSVTSSIPAYFQNSEPPIICYKYNKVKR